MAPSTERFLAISCTNVGVGPGGTTNLLARVAIVDYKGTTVFDKYVVPTTTVGWLFHGLIQPFIGVGHGLSDSNNRNRSGKPTFSRVTSLCLRFQSGDRGLSFHLADAWTFNIIQNYVSNLFRGKIIVGHSLWNDLAVLGLPHPAVDTRDVALYQPFRNALRSPQLIGLQTLSWQLMSRRCQEGQIHPLENARAALDLYRSDAEAWETSVSQGNWPCVLPPSTFSRCYL